MSGTRLLAFACLLAGGLAAGAGAGAQSDPRLDLERAWSYMEGLEPLTARFAQQDPDGTSKRGWIAVAPPGRARIEYEPPDSTILVVDGTYLVYHNPEQGQTAHIPLSDLPLRILFEGRRPGPDDRLEVLSVSEGDGYFSVRVATLGDDGVRIPGWVELVFLHEPFGLAGWILVDVQLRKTVVTLDETEPAAFTDDDLFRLTDSMIQSGDVWRGPWEGRRAPPTSPRGVR